jgi:hypothetical protein
MRNRVAQLACLLLLLTTVSAADAAARRNPVRRSEFSFGSHYIGMLMQNAATVHIDSPLLLQFDSEQDAAPLASSASLPVAFAVRPPVAQSAHVHAVTGSGI